MFNLELSSFFNYLAIAIIIIVFFFYNKKNKRLKEKLNNTEEKYLNLNNGYKKLSTDIESLKIEKTKKAEIYTDKINDLYRFAEFGKLSAGVFHDIVNPLTAIALNLEYLQQKQIKFNKSFLEDAIRCTKKMQAFIISVKKQINNKEKERYFNINEEIEDCICLLRYKARENNVRLIFKNSKKIFILGLNTKFNQVILNLISNGIDSYKNKIENNNRLVIIKINKNKTRLKILIQDFGEGIKKQDYDKIFKPFYSTKQNDNKNNDKKDQNNDKKDQNNGIGLHNSLYIIKKYFKGEIIVDSKYGKGTKMIINLDTKNKNSR
ncbi:MAG: sensor histidine kinase [Parcubacteria group bacterium]